MSEVREAIRKARWVTSIVQGTMALEGCGLDRKALREMTHRTARELLNRKKEGLN